MAKVRRFFICSVIFSKSFSSKNNNSIYFAIEKIDICIRCPLYSIMKYKESQQKVLTFNIRQPIYAKAPKNNFQASKRFKPLSRQLRPNLAARNNVAAPAVIRRLIRLLRCKRQAVPAFWENMEFQADPGFFKRPGK